MCRAALESDVGGYRCGSGHRFDRSREGYVNLLLRPPRNRASGDSLEMVHARRAFLDTGAFRRLRDAVLAELGPGTVLDLGCGEGYYTRGLGASEEHPWVGGVDVSRPAIRLAARRDQGIAYAVANAFDLPVIDHSIDNLVSVFGPVAPDEIDRVLSPAGRVVVAAPGPDHLLELKERLFTEVQRHEDTHPLAGDLRWRPLHRRRVNLRLDLDQPGIDALVGMTPYRWQIPKERQSVPGSIGRLEVTADFTVATLVRAGVDDRA